MNQNIILKTDDFLTYKEKRECWNKTLELTKTMFNRQNETVQQKRREKIYIGMLSEIIFSKYFLQENKNLSLINNGFKNDLNTPEKYDFQIEDKFIDIKSSKEKKQIPSQNIEEFFLNKRNFTLPKDQVKNIDNYFIFQMMYDKKFEICFMSGFIDIQTLTKSENLKKLKLDNDNYQETYMLPLKNNISLKEVLNINDNLKRIPSPIKGLEI